MYKRQILERQQTAGPACGWQAQHLLAKNENVKVLSIAPSYIKTNSHGDFVRDWSWAAAYQQLGKIYYPKLLTALPHTPAQGPRPVSYTHLDVYKRQVLAFVAICKKLFLLSAKRCAQRYST